MRSGSGPRTYYSAPSSPVDRCPVPLKESHAPARTDCLRANVNTSDQAESISQLRFTKNVCEPPIVSRSGGWDVLAGRYKRAHRNTVCHASPADLLADASTQVVAPFSLSQRVPASPSARGQLLLRRANTDTVPSIPRVRAGPRLTLRQMSPLPRVAASQLPCRSCRFWELPAEDTKPWSLHWVESCEVAHFPQPSILRQHQQPMQHSHISHIAAVAQVVARLPAAVPRSSMASAAPSRDFTSSHARPQSPSSPTRSVGRNTPMQARDKPQSDFNLDQPCDAKPPSPDFPVLFTPSSSAPPEDVGAGLHDFEDRDWLNGYHSHVRCEEEAM